MALAVEAPARDDLSFRTNDDKRVGAQWRKSDATTAVVVDTATLTLRFDPPPGLHVDPRIVEPPVEHRITSTTPGDPDGWIDPTGLPSGVVLVTVPYAIWASYTGRTGVWDLVADGEGVRRCLVRGRFATEEGVS